MMGTWDASPLDRLLIDRPRHTDETHLRTECGHGRGERLGDGAGRQECRHRECDAALIGHGDPRRARVLTRRPGVVWDHHFSAVRVRSYWNREAKSERPTRGLLLFAACGMWRARMICMIGTRARTSARGSSLPVRGASGRRWLRPAVTSLRERGAREMVAS